MEPKRLVEIALEIARCKGGYRKTRVCWKFREELGLTQRQVQATEINAKGRRGKSPIFSTT